MTYAVQCGIHDIVVHSKNDGDITLANSIYDMVISDPNKDLVN